MSSPQVVEKPVGQVTIAPQVLTTIVRETTLRTQGVGSLISRTPRRSKIKGRRAMASGIEVVLSDGEVYASVYVNADPGANMLHLAETLQQEIARAIDHIVGLNVAGVDVYIDDVSFTASGVPFA